MKNKKEITIHSSKAEYLTFVTSTGSDEKSVEMRYEDENIWLTQKMMAELYDVSISAINQHFYLFRNTSIFCTMSQVGIFTRLWGFE